MPNASPLPIDHFSAFLARLRPDLDIEAVARDTNAFRRRRGVRCGSDLLRLALAGGPGGYSNQRVAAWAGERNIATLTEDARVQRPEDALVQRLHAAAPFREELTRRLLIPFSDAPCWHGRCPRVSDGTCLSQQASKATDWRVHGVYDIGRAGFTTRSRRGPDQTNTSRPSGYA